MDSEKDYIDKLYSEKFEKFEFHSSGDDWSKLNGKLGKSNFLKFSFATFNIFFLGALLAFAGTATFLGVTNIKKSEKIEELEKKVEIFQEKENKSIPSLVDSIIIENQDNRTEISDEIKALNAANKNEVLQKLSETKEKTIAPEIVIKKDSVHAKTDSATHIKSEPPKINKVKKTIFIKKDKVVLKDTVVIKKKEK